MPVPAVSQSAVLALALSVLGPAQGWVPGPPAARAASASVPTLSVEGTCRAAEQRQGPGLQTYQACMADEAQARQTLAAGLWRKAKADTRTTCLANETVGGFSSYIDLLACVQLFEGIVIKPHDQQ